MFSLHIVIKSHFTTTSQQYKTAQLNIREHALQRNTQLMIVNNRNRVCDTSIMLYVHALSQYNNYSIEKKTVLS